MKSFLSQEKPASVSSSFMNSVMPLMSPPPPGAVPTLCHAASSSPETGNNMKVPQTLYLLAERLRGRSNGCTARTQVHQAANNHSFWCQLYGSVKKKTWWSYGQLICVIHFPFGCKSVAVLPTWFIALRRGYFKIPRISPGILLAAEMTPSLLGHICHAFGGRQSSTRQELRVLAERQQNGCLM